MTAPTTASPHTPEPAETPPRNKAPAARLVTEIGAPWVLIIALFLAVGAHDAGWAGLGWGLAGAFFASLGPMALIAKGTRSGDYSDHHLTERSHRTRPLLGAVGLVVAGLALGKLADAPNQVYAVMAAMLAGLAVTVPITLRWKISFHAGVAAALVGILTLVFGPAVSIGWLLVAVIAWSRVRLGDHTIAQVLAGAIIAGGAATLVFWLAA
ncbi:phosphatase PAP2 family protein [Actinomadura violacea]|uniref:Phosphatase PAP2 family protein n=1 Tax=Actinomadura violacea TaxID=2819934 RepID=A0ABS3S898_9ACTN|nr:phosphatase PAP2 family protein [Actinomadura violacea]MBO2464455.1 phosphatase PAP2 family protein [Actinomadura violacea]